MSVIEWFKNMRKNESRNFICFDIIEFYPSISEELLNRTLDFASVYDTISEDERGIILQPKKSLLSHNKDLWQKKSNSTFDVAMGSYDSAETCELVGCYLLSKL